MLIKKRLLLYSAFVFKVSLVMKFEFKLIYVLQFCQFGFLLSVRFSIIYHHHHPCLCHDLLSLLSVTIIHTYFIKNTASSKRHENEQTYFHDKPLVLEQMA